MIQHIEVHLLPRWVLQSVLNVNHTSSNPLQRAKSSRGTAAAGGDFGVQVHSGTWKASEESTQTQRTRFHVRWAPSLSSPRQWPPIFLQESSVMPNLVSLSYLSHPMLNSSPLHHCFPTLSWNSCVEGVSQLELSWNEWWVKKRWHYTHSRVTASALTHPAIIVVRAWPPAKLQQLAPASYSCCNGTKGEPEAKTPPPSYAECCQLSARPLCPTKPPDTWRPEPCDCVQLQSSQTNAKSLIH